MMNWEQHFRQMKRHEISEAAKRSPKSGKPVIHMNNDTPFARFGVDYIPPEDVGFGDEASDNVNAIRDYFVRTNAKTQGAVVIKDSFIKWYDGLTWITSEDNDLARNQRNTFNLANATTAAEVEIVQNVIKTGQSQEHLMGLPDRRLSTGMMPGPVAPPKPPLIPTKYLIIGIVVLGLSLVMGTYGAAKGYATTRAMLGH